MKNIILLLLLSGTLIQASCGKVAAKVFGPKTPREQYEKQIGSSKLMETPEGRRWKAAGELALAQPVQVSLPYKVEGKFPESQQLAMALQFNAPKGQRLQFLLNKKQQSDFTLFAELFAQEIGTGTQQLLYSADTSLQTFTYDIETEGTYVLRLQPELLKGGTFVLTITQGPSIGFPVSDNKANIGSLWGVARDGGKRKHEGIDIFAPKGSPAVAAFDGMVTGVSEGGIGGKVVWLRPVGKDYTLYYAHLDHQSVTPGQMVKQGDVLGTVGNTGNAKNTPAHLHFGIYTFRGPVDPLPFINKVIKKPAAVPEKSLASHMRMVNGIKSAGAKANTMVTPLAVSATGYLAALPDGRILEAPFASLQLVKAPLKKEAVIAPVAIFVAPAPDAQQKHIVPQGSKLEVLGYFNEYAFVRSGSMEGWMLQDKQG
jgi:murein DD-endopeptidase MepM/ murein hydrolase activator NlpD